jgi:purine-nucleoside phosphorylase
MQSADPYVLAAAAAAELASHTGVESHEIAVILGSGWAGCADALGQPAEARRSVTMSSLPGFVTPSASGHGNTIRSIELAGKRVLVFLGRCHLYEGHEPATVVHSVRMAHAAGCRTVILTNASGCMHEAWGVGVPVLVRDHINFTGRSPLTGPLPPNGIRFIDMSNAYSPRLRALAKSIDPTLHEGTYMATNGPQFETPAEIVMGAQLGCDLVGMSTVLEVIAARHLDMEVLAIALSTNLAAGVGAEPLTVEDVINAATAAQPRMGALLRAIVEEL